MSMAESRPAPKELPRRRGPQVFGIPFNVFRAGVFLLGLFPLARWLVLGFTGGLTADPISFLIKSAGTWTLVVLLVTLAITPLRVITGQAGLVKVRRMAGLFTLFYASLHFMSYVWWDQWFSIPAIADDILKRPFILVGFLAFLALIPLGVTSTKGWVRRLGGMNWQRLHRLIYPIGALALLHLWWIRSGKNDFLDAGVYLGVLIALLGWRVWHAWRRRASIS
ncbi:sulfite oxidase heme-binding subunit YedZ [Agaricicola taiwanensis]|nr:protein-methionine-sulfoxide reductase heme-binding subunit MsrQ [Agaricicola taiwanensis]